MMPGSDIRPDLVPILDVFGVPGIVTVEGQAPVETTVVWMSSTTDDQPGGGFSRREELKVIAVSRSAVPEMPTGTRIVAPELLGGADKTWRVDGFDRLESDLTRVIVVEVDEIS